MRRRLPRFFGYLLVAVAALGGCAPSPTGKRDSALGPGEFRSSEEISPAGRLRKLSLHLRGVTPDAGEYELLEKRAGDAAEPYFHEKTKEYLASPSHAGKMVDRLNELFRMKSSLERPEALTAPGSVRMITKGYEDAQHWSSLSRLFFKIARDNLSWDQLLVAKNYEVLNDPPVLIGDDAANNVSFTMPGDLGFFGIVAPGLPPSYDGAVRAPFKADKFEQSPPPDRALVPLGFGADDPRIAGTLTTARFARRYRATNLNHGRTRAAAVFRIFLCDDMRAALLAPPGEFEDLINKAFPTQSPPAKARFSRIGRNTGGEDPHGQDPACMACHYKLDPLGSAFRGVGSALFKDPTAGALVFRREDGALVNVPGRGIGDVARAITQQPEYAQCQVRHFWNWFVGEDIPLKPARLAELTRQYDASGRRTNDFIEFLVNQPEFYHRSPALPPAERTFVHVKPILAHCNGCHSGAQGPVIPDFTRLPLGGSVASHLGWLRKISERMSLPAGGAGRTMPPKNSPWQPEAADVRDLRLWLKSGAKDESGAATIDPRVGSELSGLP